MKVVKRKRPKWDNVNPGLINPKRLFNWEGTIYVPVNSDYLEGTPTIFINHGLAKSRVDIKWDTLW